MSQRAERRAPLIPLALACPDCQNMMQQMGNGVYKCWNCGYISTG
ncbi:hypothetical protein ABZ951_08315 [Streptomyces sp. NPDC046215]|uniref:Transposase zinc-ribbon domain-containing protein n=1 Tax=Streptomyces stramineus TaxID=173861 RepID=A0ABN0ZKD2_9ACTN